jgi:hypothetical protein
MAKNDGVAQQDTDVKSQALRVGTSMPGQSTSIDIAQGHQFPFSKLPGKSSFQSLGVLRSI